MRNLNKNFISKLLTKKGIDYRNFIYILCFAAFINLVLTLFIANYITKYFFDGLRDQESELIIGAVESGPLAFARLQSAELSQQVLDRLMKSSSLIGRGVESVRITGGETDQFLYSSWISNRNERDARCSMAIDREFKFPDSIHPFHVKLGINKCSSLPENNTIRFYSIAATFFLFVVMFAILLAVFKLIFDSMKNAERILDKRNDVPPIEDIVFLPIRRLAIQALKSLKQEKEAALLQIAHQVSHDIRSPLSAMEMISSQLSELPEIKRIIIRNSIGRIRDIANSLSLGRSQGNMDFKRSDPDEITAESSLGRNSLDTILLLPTIDLMITEKRIEYRNKLNVNINFEQTLASYGLFAKIRVQEFKRLFSNIINNGVEALPDVGGRVDVTLEENSFGQIQIKINDTGKGISSKLISQIGIRGNTFNKQGGSGLGLAHAVDAIKGFSGRLNIESREGSGTTITIVLPKEIAPEWFVPKLLLKKTTKVFVFDDDQSIHQIWQGRLNSVQKSGEGIHLFHFSDPDELRKYYRQNFADLDDVLFLMDYEILNHQQTGLDLIEELGIQLNSILITSRYEETSIRLRCESLGVRLIPKSMSGFVPIKIV